MFFPVRFATHDAEDRVSKPSDLHASPRIAMELSKVLGRASAVSVTMRATKDVSKLIRKLDAATKKAAQSHLHFG
jgi:hypothetical protein